MSAGSLLELRKVSAGYGSFQALFEVDLEVRAGEAVAVIGPNGAGKTTLLRVISRLIGNRQGELLMDGKRYDALPAWDVIGLGIAQVPEGRRLFPRLTVEDNLRIARTCPARAAGSRRASSSSIRCSRGCRSGGCRWPAPCPAASSRCAPSAAR